MGNLKIKRIYEEPLKVDGIRILIDRLWPRGISKERAHLDYWFKDIAPSSDLRKWFNHEPKKFKEFRKCYKEELKCEPEKVKEILKLLEQHNVTLIYAAKNPKINHAIVLKDYIKSAKKLPTKHVKLAILSVKIPDTRQPDTQQHNS